MKICHILWGLTYGGIETMVVNIANEQAALGHEVHLIIINNIMDIPLRNAVDKSVKFHNMCRSVGSKNPMPLLKLNIVILKIRPDVVHFHEASLNKYVLRPLLRRACTTHHNDHVDHLVPYLQKGIKFFSISEGVRAHIKAVSGYDTEVVMNGIDTARFVRKKKFYSGSGPFRIVQVGRLLMAEKGQDVLIDAIGLLREKNIDVTADIIGAGPSEAELNDRIRSAGLEGSVNMLGAKTQDYISRHLAEYDLLVQPSRMEGFGLTIVEAMSSCVPVLVSDLEALTEVIDNGRCGYSFMCGNPNDMAMTIERIITEYNPEIAERARQRVVAFYDVRATAAKYIEKYKELS